MGIRDKRLVIKEKDSKLCNWVLTFALIVSISTAAFAGWNLYKIYTEYSAGTDEYAKIHEMVVEERKAGIEEKPVIIEENKKKWVAPLEIDFEQLRSINSDVAGWIYIEAIPEISYPIVKGNDNEFYLHHTYEKTDNFAGSIFMDFENTVDFNDCNTIIYGHNMRNGSMFGQLKAFKKPEIIQNSTVIWILTPEDTYKYELFSAYTVPVNTETYTLIMGPGKELKEYAEHMQSNSEISLQTRDFDEKDKIITLSTCTGDASTRYVVQAVRVEPE